MGDGATLVRVFITLDPLALGEVPEAWAEIQGDVAIYGPYAYRAYGEGAGWHRTRSAAENYARQVQMAKLDQLRAEVDRIERMRFGRPGP